MKRRIEQESCDEHDNYECDEWSDELMGWCPGGSSREVTVDGTFTVKTNPTPTEGPYGEPQEDYPIVEQGIFETTHTTLPPGEYAVIALVASWPGEEE